MFNKPIATMLVSVPGGGKSTLIPTLPWYPTTEEEYEMAQKFDEMEEEEIAEYQGQYILSFLFDPQGIEAYAHGINRMKVLKIMAGEQVLFHQIKNKAQARANKAQQLDVKGYNKYHRFASRYNNMVRNGELKEYKWVIFDSLTFLADAILWEIVDKEGRLGDKTTIEDFGRLAVLVKSISDSCLSAGVPLVMTAHTERIVVEALKDGTPVSTELHISTYGKLRAQFPAMFGNVLLLDSEIHGSNVVRQLHVHRDGSNQFVRSVMRDAPTDPIEIALDFEKPTRTQGLYQIFREFTPTFSPETADIEEI